MLELGDAKLELVPLLAGDQTELAQNAVHGGAGLLADTHRVAAPARGGLVDPTAYLVAAHPAARRERICELVRTLRGQRGGADESEQQALNGLVHAGAPGGAAGAVHVSPGRQLRSCRPRRPQSRPAQARGRALRPPPPRPPRTLPRDRPW